MKFNVGDKVRFVKSIIYHNKAGELGEIYTVQDVYKRSYRIENGEWFNEEELVLANYTYEDLKKSPIGTKVMFENGKILIKLSDKRYDNEVYWREESDLEKMKDIVGNFGKIVKIEEPTYTTVYEYKPEILDEVEKRYLRGVIRPFRDDIEHILKCKHYNSTNDVNCEYISIIYKDDVDTNLHDFKANTMYKGMELDKEYTLEELGL